MASGNIKGITIEFRGETGPLENALKQIDGSVKNIDKELRQVNNGLKFNPTNVKLWEQKQTLLNDKVKETKDRLDALKKAQKQMDAKGVDKNSQEYRELQREIITTESKLKTFKGQLRKIGDTKLKALSEQFKMIGDKAKSVGESLTKNVTVPLAAIAGASIAAFSKVDDGLDIVIKKTGATGKKLDGMEKSLKKLTSEIPTDFSTAGTAIGEVSTRFHLTGKELEDLSGKFIKFAALNDTDVTSAVDQTQKALSAFGLSATDAGDLLDQLNVVGQQTGADMNTLLSGLIQNATGFQEMGLSAQQAAVLMGQMETSGANAETVMQGLRKALKNATDQGIPLDKALSDLQNTILNGKGGVDGLTAAYELFGKSGDQIYSAVKNGTLDFQNLGTTVTDAGGSINDTFEATLDPTDKFKTALNDLTTAGSELGSVLLETLVPILEEGSNAIRGITEAWNGLSPGVQDAIVKAGMVIAVVGPIVSILSKVIFVIGILIKVIAVVAGVIAGALEAPIAAVVAVIAALIAAIVFLVTHFEELVDIVGGVLSDLWELIKDIFGAIVDAVRKLFGLLKDGVVAAWNGITSFISGAVTAIKNTVTSVFNAIKNTVSNIINGIKNTVSNVFNAIKNTVSNIINGIKNAITNVFNGIKNTISNIFNSIKTTATNIWNKIKEAISKPIEKAKETVQKAIDKIKNVINKVKLQLPKFKLPHFKISGGKIPWGLGGAGEKPKISVDWYAKGGIFDGASLIGVGEKGPEAVVPLDTLWNKLDAIAEASSGPTVQIVINAAPGMDVKELAAEVERRLIASTNRRRLAW